MTSPIGPNDIIVDLGPDRDPRLPTIYNYMTASHPKKSGPEEELRIPHGPESLAILAWLEEHDIVFVRSSTAPASGEEDVAACWVTGGSLYTQEEKESLLTAGKKEDRTRQAPTKMPAIL